MAFQCARVGCDVNWAHLFVAKEILGCVEMLRCDYPGVTITKGALRQVSEVCEGYVTQQGSVGTRTGLGFNVCVALI